MGRPTDNPKPYRIAARLDEESKQILDHYCEKQKVSIMEAVRRAIHRLKDEPDKK
ncbi:MAG: hypothetical protein DBY45_08125 [Clostridiales bacterium]|nr:MAG: hypothetical protein DBY45_08125 [Clostridiales bacterium]